MLMTPEDETTVREAFNILAKTIHATAVEHGFWERQPSVPDRIAYIHGEVSEALDGYTRGKMDKHLPEHPSVTVEFADAVALIVDTCAANGFQLGDALVKKMAVNHARPRNNGHAYDENGRISLGN
jgi:NTP pyrophosphatase (non-canonical NTP hydrolase)